MLRAVCRTVWQGWQQAAIDSAAPALSVAVGAVCQAKRIQLGWRSAHSGVALSIVRQFHLAQELDGHC
jgi:hypothetical protein